MSLVHIQEISSERWRDIFFLRAHLVLIQKVLKWESPGGSMKACHSDNSQLRDINGLNCDSHTGPKRNELIIKNRK